jgi:hypothetical protein
MDHLAHPARSYLATSTRCLLALLEQAQRTYAPRQTGLNSSFGTLKNGLLGGLSKVASPRRYFHLGYLETLLVRTVLAPALKAAKSDQESNAVLDLQRLKRAIPDVRTRVAPREDTALFILRLFVTSDDLLTQLVLGDAPGQGRKAA